QAADTPLVRACLLHFRTVFHETSDRPVPSPWQAGVPRLARTPTPCPSTPNRKIGFVLHFQPRDPQPPAPGPCLKRMPCVSHYLHLRLTGPEGAGHSMRSHRLRLFL